jgi:VIT1/CCC1 family predicted Fe2+/Mn2+ transporter
MKISIRKGLGFGLTSGIITTLGLIVGLNSGTHSKSVVFGGILIIAIADALSDAMGIHISEEAGHKDTSKKELWESTISTFGFKFIFALSFVIPILLFNLSTAIIVSVIWGLSLLAGFSYYIARKQGTSTKKAVIEHLVIAVVVIIITNFVGKWINQLVLS